MPEFRTYVMRSRTPAGIPPQALRRHLRTVAWVAAIGLVGVLSLDAWTAIASDASQFLRALPWLAASWH